MTELIERIKQEFNNNPIQTIAEAASLLVIVVGIISSMTKGGKEFWKRLGSRLSLWFKEISLLTQRFWSKLYASPKRVQELENKIVTLEGQVEEVQRQLRVLSQNVTSFKALESDLKALQSQIKEINEKSDTANYSTRMVYRFLDAAYRLNLPRQKVFDHAILEVIKRESVEWNTSGKLTIFYGSVPDQANNPLSGEWVGYLEMPSSINAELKNLIKKLLVSNRANLKVDGHQRTIFVAQYIENRNELVLCTEAFSLNQRFDPYYW